MTFTSRRFDYLSWPKALDAAKTEGSTLIWPFGACEQHGPHLPLATDSVFAENVLCSVLERLPEGESVWMLPAQQFGFSPEHSSFPGTISLSASLTLRIVIEVGQQLASLGFKRLVFFNAHGGQIGLLQASARELRQRCPQMAVLPCFLWNGVSELKDLIDPEELEKGLHAGLAETSLMLSIAPHLVGEERPVDGLGSSSNGVNTSPPVGWSLEGAAPFAWLTKDLSFSGVIGDSRKANKGLGDELESALVDHWVKLLTNLMNSDWPLI